MKCFAFSSVIIGSICLVLVVFCFTYLHSDVFSVQLLGRVFNILRENNPELAGDRRRTVMRPPQVLREGTKKTVFVNFMDLCKTYVDLFFIYSVVGYMCNTSRHVFLDRT